MVASELFCTLMEHRMTTRLTRTALIDRYHRYGRPRTKWLVGGEFERHILDVNGMPATYDGEPGIRSLLQSLVQRGWQPIRERGALIGCVGENGANVTLEPGAQFELSGAPHKTPHEVLEEAKAFAGTVDELLEGTSLRQATLGLTPTSDMARIRWVPKGRYVIMRNHMARSGPLGQTMMKGTAATQASYDYEHEFDAAQKLKLARNIAPLVTAMFANSPYQHGQATGWMSSRGRVWMYTDPARTGFPDSLNEYRHERWVDYLLDVPMMFMRKGSRWLPANGKSFRTWMAETGPDAPTWADWELHQTSVFPEVRIKAQIEVRGADCVNLPIAGAFVALFHGLFYCPRSRDEALALGAQFSAFGSQRQRFEDACRHGLRATVGGRRMAWWASRLLTIASEGRARCSPDAPDMLAPLEALVSKGITPADVLLYHLGRSPDIGALLELTAPDGRAFRQAADVT